ncbi:MAG: hypothetical protein U0525_05675 [Patescibacteria group bacterium]
MIESDTRQAIAWVANYIHRQYKQANKRVSVVQHAYNDWHSNHETGITTDVADAIKNTLCLVKKSVGTLRQSDIIELESKRYVDCKDCPAFKTKEGCVLPQEIKRTRGYSASGQRKSID